VTIAGLAAATVVCLAAVTADRLPYPLRVAAGVLALLSFGGLAAAVAVAAVL
jgi:hypothetical protein